MEAKMYKAYCIKCKKKVEVSEPELKDMVTSKGTKKFVRGKCSECGTKVCAILKKDGTQNK